MLVESELVQLAHQLVDLPGQCADVGQLAERDPDLGGEGELMEASTDPRQDPRVVQRPWNEAGLKLRIELKDVEVQPVLGAGAFSDELLAMIVQ